MENNVTADLGSPEYKALVDRWNGFLEKIKSRYYEVLEQAKGPMDEMFDTLEFNQMLIYNLLNGLKHQTVEQLTTKTEESWHKMSTELGKVKQPSGGFAKTKQKHLDLLNWMKDDFERYSIKTYANAARKYEENVRKHIDENKLINCVQCGGELPIEVYSFNALNVKCTSCGSVNTYEPDGRIRMLEGGVCHLADEYAMEEKLKAEDDIKFKAAYYKKYYGFIIEKIPSKKEHYERLMTDKLSNPVFVGK